MTILGEPRDTIAVDLSGVVYGGDDQMAKALEEQITVGVTTDGPLMKLALTLPKRDDLARRPRVQLTLRVPARLGIELRLGGGELDVTNVAAVQVVKASGRIRLASIAGAVTGELGPGEIEIDHVGSVAIETRSSQVRIANVAGSFEAEARRGDFRARGIGGPAHLEGKDVEAELEDLAGPLRLTGSGGEVRVRDVRGAITAETERTTLKLTPRHGGRHHGDDRARRDRADAAAGRDPARRAGDRRRHPHAGRADRRAAHRRRRQGQRSAARRRSACHAAHVARRHYCPLSPWTLRPD